LEFRRRHNDYYATLPATGSRDAIGVVTRTNIESTLWLGIADRVLVRQLNQASSVLLDIEAWRTTIVDGYNWLPAHTYMVGARIEEGVFGVIEGGKPMLRTIAREKDRLGRKVKMGAEEPTPWFMRTL